MYIYIYIYIYTYTRTELLETMANLLCFFSEQEALNFLLAIKEKAYKKLHAIISCSAHDKERQYTLCLGR